MFRDILATATDNPQSQGFATYLDSGDIVIVACRPIQRLPIHFAKAVHTHLGLTIQAAEEEARRIQEP
jgi:hypothetical protein